MKTIDTENHFYTQEYVNYLRSRTEYPREIKEKDTFWLYYTSKIFETHGRGLEERLLNLGEGRLKEMNDLGIDMAALSLTLPGCEEFDSSVGIDLAKKTNDELAEVVKRYPDRFFGLSALPCQNPAAAADELERTVTELGFKGAKIQPNVGDLYLDDKRFLVIFEKAAKLDVPIFIHPTTPTPGVLTAYEDYGWALGAPAVGFAVNVVACVMRMIFNGLFDKFPNLKIILGHLGEGLPFWLYRLNFVYVKPWCEEDMQIPLQKKPCEYLKTNFYYTTSGLFAQPPFLCTYLSVGADKMMLGIDYPYEITQEGMNFMRSIPVCDEDKEKILHGTAEKLFKLS